MKKLNSIVELSVIIPTYNEEKNIQNLVNNLSKQEGIVIELIISDGGSTDNTKDLIKRLKNKFSFDIIYLSSKKGRGEQMNSGAKLSNAENILFLHADSLFTDKFALKSGVACLLNTVLINKTYKVAARYALKFKFANKSFYHSDAYKPYFFYESKARLDFAGCINGDQGFLLKRSFFNFLGGFDTSIPFLEDKVFEKNINNVGKWILLDSKIHTSARRFVKEGLLKRQTLNAIIMNLFNAGCIDYIKTIPDLYKNQSVAGKLKLFPYLKSISSFLNKMSFIEYLKFWYNSGQYVYSNAWQLIFLLDVWGAFKKQEYIKYKDSFFLKIYKKFFFPITNNFIMFMFVALLTFTWFNIVYLYQRFNLDI